MKNIHKRIKDINKKSTLLTLLLTTVILLNGCESNTKETIYPDIVINTDTVTLAPSPASPSPAPPSPTPAIIKSIIATTPSDKSRIHVDACPITYSDIFEESDLVIDGLIKKKWFGKAIDDQNSDDTAASINCGFVMYTVEVIRSAKNPDGEKVVDILSFDGIINGFDPRSLNEGEAYKFHLIKSPHYISESGNNVYGVYSFDNGFYRVGIPE